MEPEEIKGLEKEIEALEAQKEAAVKAEAYEKAGEIKKKQQKRRDKIDRIRTNGRRKSIPAGWW